MTDLVLSHTTALEVMRRPYFPRHLATAASCETELPAAMPDASDLERAASGVSQLEDVGPPFHVLVGDPACRHRFSLVAPHVFQGKLPPGALLRLGPGARCASPALLAVQMAPFLTRSELLMLLCELLGTYAVSPASRTGTEGRLRPLLTPERLLAFLDELGPARGTAIVRSALSSAPVGAASPMEGKLYIRATSRFASGGYRLGSVALNDPVELERISTEVGELRVRQPDLLLLAPEGVARPFRGVAFDYHGEWHSRDPCQVKRDSERANETGSARALCLPEGGGTLATSTGSVLVRLRFQLADGVAEAALTVSDAVLAAADESESLATTTAALTVVNATVQRG